MVEFFSGQGLAKHLTRNPLYLSPLLKGHLHWDALSPCPEGVSP